MNASGSTTWTSNGVAVCTASFDQTYPTAAADGFGGVVISWNDARAASSDTYVQRLTGSGTALWAPNGVKPYTSAYYHNISAILSDGAGGAIVAWDQTAGTSDIQAQHLNASGAVLWGSDGTAISSAAGYQQNPGMVSDGNNGAIVWFTDSRRGYSDLFAQRIDRYGLLGSPEPTIASIKDVPNDQGGKVKLSWNPSWLDTESNAAFGYYGIFRSVPGSVANAAIRAGATRLDDFSHAPVPGERAFVANPASANAFAWEYVSNQYSNHLGLPYAYLAPTTGDSIGAYNPRTTFMVVVFDPSGLRSWQSV